MENRPNNEVNHLQFDYRNACAIINFTHKPCCADEEKVQIISENIKRKITNTHVNYLENLKNIQFGTIENPYLKFSELKDFPKLSEEEMKDEIFFGSFYMKRSRSYFTDILKNDAYCEITTAYLNTQASLDETSLINLSERLNKYKIIAMNITASQKKSLKRKLKPNEFDDRATEVEDESTKVKTEKYNIKYKVFIEYEKHSVESKLFIIL